MSYAPATQGAFMGASGRPIYGEQDLTPGFPEPPPALPRHLGTLPGMTIRPRNPYSMQPAGEMDYFKAVVDDTAAPHVARTQALRALKERGLRTSGQSKAFQDAAMLLNQ